MSETTAVPIGDEEFTGTDTFDGARPVRRGRARAGARAAGRPTSTGPSPRLAPSPPTRSRRGSGPRSSTPRRGCSRDADRGVRPHHRGARRPSRSRRRASRRRGRSARSRSRRSRPASWRARWSRSTPATPGEGKLGFTLRVPDRRGGRHHPVQLPAQPRRPQGGAGHRGRLPGRAQARQPDAALGHRPRRPAARRVRPARRASSTS